MKEIKPNTFGLRFIYEHFEALREQRDMRLRVELAKNKSIKEEE